VLPEQEPGIERTEAALLAYHCEQGGLAVEAATYHRRAGRQSGRRGAVAEAREHFRAALRLIATLPAEASRDRMELTTLLGLGEAVGFQKGFASSEVGDLRARLAELWERLGRPPEFKHFISVELLDLIDRSKTRRALELADNLLRSTQGEGDTQGRITGYLFVGAAKMLRGELAQATWNLEQAIGLRERFTDDTGDALDLEDTPIYPINSWITAQTWLGLVVCWLGYADRALSHSSAAVEKSRRCRELGYVVETLTKQAELLSFLGESAKIEDLLPELLTLTREHGYIFYGARATIMQGYMLALHGDPERGRALINEGLTSWTATGSSMWTSRHLALLAEAHQMLGDTEETMRQLTEALGLAERTGEQWYVPELHRRMGEAYRRQGDQIAARRCFEHAAAIARRQQAKLWELQAATSSARLLHDQGRIAEARAALVPVYAWFTEGFRTAVVQEAKSLLEELDHANT
jgi:tetratricopeptide (TPR) repeat protein